MVRLFPLVLILGCIPVRLSNWKAQERTGVITVAPLGYWDTGPSSDQKRKFSELATERCGNKEFSIVEEGVYDTGDTQSIDWASLSTGKKSADYTGVGTTKDVWLLLVL